MQLSFSRALPDNRAQAYLGRIKAATGWRRGEGPISDLEKETALRALRREAEDYDADAIIAIELSIETVSGPDQHGAPLRRVIALGEAIKFKAAA